MRDAVCMADTEGDGITVAELRDALLHLPQTARLYLGGYSAKQGNYRARGVSSAAAGRLAVECGLRVIIPDEIPAPGPMVAVITSRALDEDTLITRNLCDVPLEQASIRDKAEPVCQCGRPLTVFREINGEMFGECSERATQIGHDSFAMPSPAPRKTT